VLEVRARRVWTPVSDPTTLRGFFSQDFHADGKSLRPQRRRPTWHVHFFHKTRLCAATRWVQDAAIGTTPWRQLMDFWVLLLSATLGIATYALYRLVDRLRNWP